jgi:DNA repair exonuclease SbcCD ATPase subunit
MSSAGDRMSDIDNSIEQAAKRLDRAVMLLEQRLSRLSGEAEAGGLFDQDRSNLASQLDQARARERELVDAGQQASQALDRAINEIRAALGEQGVH